MDTTNPALKLTPDTVYGEGVFQPFMDSNYNLTECYIVPFHNSENSGNIYLTDYGSFSAALDNCEYRYVYGDSINNEEQIAVLKSVVEEKLGSNYDDIIKDLQEKRLEDETKLEKEFDENNLDASSKDMNKKPKNKGEER